MAEDKETKEAKPRSEDTRNLVEELYFGTAEKTVAESSYHADSFIKPYNPDDLWQKTGDYSIYEEMRKDDQVHVGLQLKKDLVIGSGWDIVSSEEGQEDIAKDIFARLDEDPEHALDEHLDELIDTAYSYGFSLSEKIFQLREDQSLTFKELKTRHPSTWTIHTNDKGNVTKYEQHGSNQDLDIKANSLIHYRLNPMHQNPYGTADLRTAYAAWFTKRHIIRFYSIFLEKHASPIPYAKYDNNTPTSKVNEMFEILKKFQTKTAIVIPKAFEVDFLQSTSNGEAYIKGINLFNMIIGRSLLMPDLIGLSGSETAGGSFSLGKEQIELFLKHVRRRRKALERMVNRHIVQPLIVWNHGIMDNYPKFVLAPISEGDALEYAKTFVEAMKGRLYKPNDEEINHFRDLIKFPEGEVLENEIPGPVEPSKDPSEPSPVDNNNEPIDNNNDNPNESDLDDIKKDEFKKKFVSPYNGDKIEFDKRVDYASIKNQLESTQKKIVDETKPIVDEILEDMINQIEKKKILNVPPKPERVNDLKVKKLSQLQQVIKKQLRQHFTESKVMARAELFKAKFATPLPSDEFLAFLENETFQYVGDWEYRVNQDVRLELNNAIKEGRPLSSVITFIENDVKNKANVSIERYARTKTTEVLNKGRLEEFEKSKAVHGYQYSAIMDDRTTTICDGLHGKKFVSGTEPIPPLHFNCRSLLLPITIFEEFNPDNKVGKTEINTFIDDNKGKGFSSK